MLIHFRHAAVAAFLLLPGKARATITTLSTSGSWMAYAATATDNNLPICGVMTTGSEGRSLILKFVQGDTRLVLTMLKTSWQIPDHTKLPVSMTVGNNTPWTSVTEGSGQTVEIGIPTDQVSILEHELRTSSSMSVSFTSGNEPDWKSDLTGISAELNDMRQCIQSMPHTSEPTPPFGSAPAQSGMAPTQPAAPAPDHSF